VLLSLVEYYLLYIDYLEPPLESELDPAMASHASVWW
jgi:hypothetical protein